MRGHKNTEEWIALMCRSCHRECGGKREPEIQVRIALKSQEQIWLLIMVTFVVTRHSIDVSDDVDSLRVPI